ncbi:MAG TPA: hypothetical protein VGJ09_09875 [Bryobacteraceae bacterium]
MRMALLAFFVIGIAWAQTPAPIQAPATAKQQLQLRGDRFPGLTYDEMTPQQKALTDRALAGRGTIGTFNILLRSPGLSEAMRGAAGGRAGSPLTAKQSELAIIINARYWTTQFEWLVHHRSAVQAGVSEATVAAIAEGRRPASMPPDEEVVYNFVRELLKTKQVSDPTFIAAKSLLGERGIVDLIGLVGFYQATSLMMNVDRYPMQSPNQKPELRKLESTLP